MIEVIGYVASAFVLISFMMKNMTALRWVSIVGCIAFVIYGSLLPSVPVIITNAAIIAVNVYYLFFKKKD